MAVAVAASREACAGDVVNGRDGARLSSAEREALTDSFSFDQSPARHVNMVEQIVGAHVAAAEQRVTERVEHALNELGYTADCGCDHIDCYVARMVRRALVSPTNVHFTACRAFADGHWECPTPHETAALARPVGGCLHGPGKPDGPDLCPNCGTVTPGGGA